MPSRKLIIRTGAPSDTPVPDTPGRDLPVTSNTGRPTRTPRRQNTGLLNEACHAGEYRKVQPMDNVYTFLMFTLPLEQALHQGKMTWRCLIAICLVTFTLLIKGILLYAIFNAVVMEDLEWQGSILSSRTGPQMASFLGAAPEKQCNTGGSLCTEVNGTYTCAPPTVQLMGRWHELDTNGDGVWTQEEAVASRAAIQCKYVVDPVEVFDVFVKFILAREEHLWIHPDLRAGRSIHKAYFTFASGDLIMCGYRDIKMCPNLLERGVFDAPLREGTAPRVGTTIDSALNYCRGLLEEGGTCERNLPSTYGVWKVSSERQCWGARYDKYVYRHPTNGHEKSMLLVKYKAPQAYARASNSSLFRVYKGIIILLFLLAMYTELKDIHVAWTWVMNFPAVDDKDDDGVFETVGTEARPYSVRVEAISRNHRIAIGFVTFIRFLMITVLILVGVQFLMKDTDWVNLLLNGVALVFVAEIAASVFLHVVDTHMQEQFLTTEPMYVKLNPNILNKHPSIRDLLYFSVLCLFMFVLMEVYLVVVDIPLSKAVECACLSSGDQCHEANVYDHGFWQRYWTQDVPEVFETVERLKVAAASGRPISEIRDGSSQLDRQLPPPAPPPAASPEAVAAEPRAEPRKLPSYAPDSAPGGIRWHVVSVRKHPPVKKHSGHRLLNKVGSRWLNKVRRHSLASGGA